MSVQTAYHVVRHTSITSGNTLQPTTQPLALWKAIWAGQVWPKVRTFMWKLASNSLPVRSNLDRRGIPISPTCSACDEEETAEHMVRGCSWTIGVWEGVLEISTSSDSQELMVSWLNNMVSTGRGTRSQDQARWSLCMLTCWGIWKLRCTLAFESRSLRPDVVIEEIRQAFAEITGTWKPQQKREPQVSPGRWTAPREGVIKLSCDAAWTPGSGQGDLGVVARDRQGTV